MEMGLTEHQRKYKEEFEHFVDEVVMPAAGENDEQETLSEELLKEFKTRGYLGSMIAKEYGGLGMDMVTVGILNEEIGRACSSLRSLLTVHGMVALVLQRFGTQEQKDKWLPKMAKGDIIAAFALTEEKAGSDANSINSCAEEIDGEYKINGEKKWITMGQIADIFLVFVKLNGRNTAFIVERENEGFSSEKITGMLGAKASMLALLKFDNCTVTKLHMVGRMGFGISHVALEALNYGRYTIACGCVGLANQCFYDSIRYASKRQQFGRALHENQLVQKMITEMKCNIEAARLLYMKAGYLYDERDPDYILQTWISKYFASKMAVDVSDKAVQIFGANGLHSDYPVQRYWRDAKINEIIEGTSQIHEVLIGTNVIRDVLRR